MVDIYNLFIQYYTYLHHSSLTPEAYLTFKIFIASLVAKEELTADITSIFDVFELG